MKMIKIPKNCEDINWTYNEEADILYLYTRKSKTDVRVEIGEGIVANFDELQKEVVGLSLTGLRAKVLKALGKDNVSDAEVKRLNKEECDGIKKDAEPITFNEQTFDLGGEA